MKKTMKKLIALMLIMILVLPQVIAAEETTPSAMTITEEVTINEDAAKSLLPMFGVDEKLAESVSSVLNAMSSKLVIADNGAQIVRLLVHVEQIGRIVAAHLADGVEVVHGVRHSAGDLLHSRFRRYALVLPLGVVKAIPRAKVCQFADR